MQEVDILKVVSWVAVVLLSVSYWFQIWRIHIHKEVRDLSLPYHFCLAIGFGTLGFTAYIEGSAIFLIKQIATTIPVIVIISQIFYHKKDRWHDDSDAYCTGCKQELEHPWKHCPYCGTERVT